MPITRVLLLQSNTPLAQLKVRISFSSCEVSTILTPMVHAFPFQGPVKTAELTMLGYTVPNQAFSALLLFSS